jgi:hypothetical protein
MIQMTIGSTIKVSTRTRPQAGFFPFRPSGAEESAVRRVVADETRHDKPILHVLFYIQLKYS